MNKNNLNPVEIVGASVNAGVAKVNRSFKELVILGILAGAFIAFGAEASNMVAFNLLSNPETYGLGRALAGAIFSVGLMMVVITGAELFTGNCLICVAVYEKKATVGGMLRNWVIVYIANFVGSLLIAFLVVNTGLLGSGNNMLGAMTLKIAIGKVGLDFMPALFSGIMCNWLVCLAVWMAFSCDTTLGKIAAIFFPIWLFVASGFEHCVANMYFIPAGILSKSYAPVLGIGQEALDSLTWGSMCVNNLLPVTIGNIIGGAIFVGTAYWWALYKGKDSNK